MVSSLRLLTRLQIVRDPAVNQYLPDYEDGQLPEREFFFTVSAITAADIPVGPLHRLRRLAPGPDRPPAETAPPAPHERPLQAQRRHRGPDPQGARGISLPLP